MLTALDSAGMPFAIYPFNKDVETRRIGPFLESRYDRDGVYDINVALMATNQLPHYFSELRKQVEGCRYNILQTYWELAEAPPVWLPLLEQIDELWVPNSYIANAFRPIFHRKITVIPPMSTSIANITTRGSILAWKTIVFISYFPLIIIQQPLGKILWEWRKHLDTPFLIQKSKLDF